MKKEAAKQCTIGKVASVLSDTWTMLIMHYLIKRPMGFCELERALNGISTRTLTLKLTRLTEEKMITKDKNGLYTVTERGKGLREVENAMIRFQKRYL